MTPRSIGERLALAMSELPGGPLTLLALGRQCGMTRSRLSQLVNTPGASMRADTAIRLAAALGVRIEWLVLGEGGMRSVDSDIERRVAGARVQLTAARDQLASSLAAVERLLKPPRGK